MEIDIITTTTAFTYFNTVGIKRFITVNIYYLLTLHSCLLIETHFNGFTFDKLQPKKFLCKPKNTIPFFSLNTCECLIYQQLQ